MLAITPTKSKTMDPEEVRKICMDYPVTAINTLKSLARGKEGKPLRFVFASGAKAEPDQSKKLWVLQDYTLMRVSKDACCYAEIMQKNATDICRV